LIDAGGVVMPETLSGVVFFWLEQGSEGRGCWSFQDERFIKKNVPSGWCRKCGKPMRSRSNRKNPEQLSLPGILYCLPDEHEERIGDAWSYEGSWTLENGDALTVYDKVDPARAVWSGIIQFDISVNDSRATPCRKTDRKQWVSWFKGRYPAKLIPRRPREAR
jgi:hypothetical protein